MFRVSFFWNDEPGKMGLAQMLISWLVAGIYIFLKAEL